MTRIARRKRRPAQKGVQAFFSDGGNRIGWPRARFASYEFEEEVEPGGLPDHLAPISAKVSTRQRDGSTLRFSRILVGVILAVIMLTAVVGFSEINRGLQHHTGLGTNGPGTGPPVRSPSFRTITPTFYAVSNLAESIVSSNGSYTGMIATSSDDFIVAQIAYSQGTEGNLPDIAKVTDTQSGILTRIASASPGVAENFWEQVWAGRASSTTTSTNITASPDWLACQKPCVGSIIVAMTVGRYRGVAGVGSSTSIAPSTSSTYQSVNVTPTQANSTFVELLSHGAYSSCGIDAPQPGTGQMSRNCFTATTERTELFDHSISSAQTYTESYTWSQVEVQRGIYLELKASIVPGPV